MRNLLLCGLLSIPAWCAAQTSSENLVPYVKPIIGTQRMGHTYPGATVPFGMVQLSPDTDTIPYEMNGKYNGDVYKYCAGINMRIKRLLDLVIRTSVVRAILIWAIS